MATGTPGRVYPRSGFPLSFKELRKEIQVGPEYRFLEYYAVRDKVLFEDDFTAQAIVSANWALANSGGTGAANLAISAAEDGMARMASGTTSSGSVSAIGQIAYAGARSCGMEVRFKLSAVTSLVFEAGFIDAVPGSNGPGVSDVDVPTTTFTNGAVLHMDTSQTLTTMALVTNGNDTSQVAAKTATAAVTTPTAATYLTARIQINDIGQVYLWINGNLEVKHEAAAGNVNKATLLAPWFYAKTLNTTTKQLDLDYVLVWKDRNTA